MKIRPEIEIYPDPKYCGCIEDESCAMIDRTGKKAVCGLYVVDWDKTPLEYFEKEDEFKKCDQCKADYLKAQYEQRAENLPIILIAEERQRQINKEGWTLEHDDEHEDGELSMAASLYASPDDDLMIVESCEQCGRHHEIVDPWPWWDENDSNRGPSRFKAWDKREQHNRMRRLQIAGALIVAEMERLQRLEKKRDSRWIMCGLCDTAYDPAVPESVMIHDHPEPQSGEPRDAWIASKMKYSEWIIKTEEGKAWSDRAIEKANLEEYKKRFIKYITDLGIELHMAQSELDGHLESNKDDLDMSDPEDDARECLTYWEE